MAAHKYPEFERLRRDWGWSIGDHAALRDSVWTDGRAAPDSAFSADMHALLLEVEDRSMWFRWRNMIIGDVLRRVGIPPALWDIGAGNGIVTRHLQTMGIDAVAVEPGAQGARGAATRGIRHVICARFESLSLPAGSIPAVGAFDVLEHLKAPEVLMSELHRVLRPGGLFVASVPAFPALWSEADEVAGHHRRYRRATILQLLSLTGFRTVYANHHFTAVLPQLLVTRALPWRLGIRRDTAAAYRQYCRELGRESRMVEAIGRVLIGTERAWARRLPIPVGTSLIVAARRSP